MPKAKQSKKFDPRDQKEETKASTPEVTKETPETNPPSEPTPVETLPSEPATNPNPEKAQPTELQQALSVMSALAAQVESLTKKVATITETQTETVDKVDKYRKESATEKQASKDRVSKSRESKRDIMKRIWDGQEKVSFWLPYEGSEKKGSRMPVQANGYAYVHSDGFLGVPKGVMIQLPKGVFDIVAESLGQQIEAFSIGKTIDTRETNLDGEKFDPERMNR